jgi:hypothetical protein
MEGSGMAWRAAVDLGEGRLLTEGGEGDAWAWFGLVSSELGFFS